MIERCTFCGSTHETGDPKDTFNGQRIKICPEVPDPPGFIMFNPRGWVPPKPWQGRVCAECQVPISPDPDRSVRYDSTFVVCKECHDIVEEDWGLDQVMLRDQGHQIPCDFFERVIPKSKTANARPGILDTAKPPIL